MEKLNNDCFNIKNIIIPLYLENLRRIKLSHGVTGNTSGFGPEESRFEP